jgi:universal stress protein A
MAHYQKLLCVVDLDDDAASIARRALEVARLSGGDVQLLHVFEFVPVEPMGETLMPAVQIEEELLARARQRLHALATDVGIPAAAVRIECGSIKGEIIRVARDIGADLIVIGSRERHGVSILVNLTEDTVLHQAPCDVLAVRVAGGRG